MSMDRQRKLQDALDRLNEVPYDCSWASFTRTVNIDVFRPILKMGSMQPYDAVDT